MTYIELDEAQAGLSRSQTVNSLFIVLVAVVMMTVGALLRNAAAASTEPFLDEQSGIRVQIPAGWLVTQDDPTFVMQVEDPSAVPFKTLLRITLLPVGDEASPRNVVDSLTLDRAGRLSTYRVLSIEPTLLGEDEALEMDYAYVQTEVNPFLNAIPLVIRGRDVVIVDERQALVLSYREERSAFNENIGLFETFLDTLQF